MTLGAQCASDSCYLFKLWSTFKLAPTKIFCDYNLIKGIPCAPRQFPDLSLLSHRLSNSSCLLSAERSNGRWPPQGPCDAPPLPPLAPPPESTMSTKWQLRPWTYLLVEEEDSYLFLRKQSLRTDFFTQVIPTKFYRLLCHAFRGAGALSGTLALFPASSTTIHRVVTRNKSEEYSFDKGVEGLVREDAGLDSVIEEHYTDSLANSSSFCLLRQRLLSCISY